MRLSSVVDEPLATPTGDTDALADLLVATFLNGALYRASLMRLSWLVAERAGRIVGVAHYDLGCDSRIFLPTTRKAMAELVLANVASFLADGTPVTQVLGR